MEVNKLRSTLVDVLSEGNSIESIIHTLNKDEAEEVAAHLRFMGGKLYKAKGVHYRIPGVESTGFVGEDHPDRKPIVDHINKLITLPDDHPMKQVAFNVAKALYHKHLDPSSAQIEEPKKVAAPKNMEPTTIDYGQKPPKPNAKIGETNLDDAARKIKADEQLKILNPKTQA